MLPCCAVPTVVDAARLPHRLSRCDASQRRLAYASGAAEAASGIALARRCASGHLTRSVVDAAESYLTRLRGTLSTGRLLSSAPSRFLAVRCWRWVFRRDAWRLFRIPCSRRLAASVADATAALLRGPARAGEGRRRPCSRSAGHEGDSLRVIGDGPERRASAGVGERQGSMRRFAVGLLPARFVTSWRQQACSACLQSGTRTAQASYSRP